MENYNIVRKIGSGSYANVFLAMHAVTGEQVALKLIDKREYSSIKTRRRLNSEITNIKLVQGHQSIINVYETFETPKYFVIAMEYVSGGELFDYIQKKDGMNETTAQEMFINIVHGVQHCHEKGVAHRDLKLENILLDKDHQPKIADFGFSKIIPSRPLTASRVGSPLYSSPEIIQGKPYQGPECDVWSLGVILYTMLTATMPFDDSNMGQFLMEVENGDYPEPCGTSNAVKDLMSRMLDPNSRTRFTLKEVLSHPWMTGICRKESPLLFNKKRRQAVSYENAEYISNELQDFDKCSCSCHHTILISKHCDDCRDIQANDPEILLRRKICPNNSSLNSSVFGSEIYGSDLGNQYWENISLSRIDLLGIDLSSFQGHCDDVPHHRKSSAGTLSHIDFLELNLSSFQGECADISHHHKNSAGTIINSTISRKTSHHKFSFPVLTPVILSEDSEDEDEDDDVVFV